MRTTATSTARKSSAQSTEKPLLYAHITSSSPRLRRDVGLATHRYRGPSVSGYMCEPRIDPHCPIAWKSGIAVARFVSDARFCVTVLVVSPREAAIDVESGAYTTQASCRSFRMSHL